MISVSDLARLTRETNPHFFTRKTMQFFGDTMRNFYVSGPVTIVTVSGKLERCYELARRRPVKHGLCSSSYWNCETFEREHIRSDTPADRMFDLSLKADYLGVDTRGQWKHHTWDLVLTRGRRKFRMTYHAGLGHDSSDPDLRSVLTCLQLDSQAGAMSEHEASIELGCDRKTWKKCVSARKRLDAFFGDMFETFMSTQIEE